MHQKSGSNRIDMNHNSVTEKVKYRFSQIGLQIVSDIIAIVLSYFVQYYIRFLSGWVESTAKPDIKLFLMSTIVMLVYWFLLLFFSGMYKNWYVRSPFDEAFSLIRVTFVGTIIIVFSVYSDSAESPRMLFLVYFPLTTLFLIIGRTVNRRFQLRLRKNRIITIPAIIIGNWQRAELFYRKTEASPSWGYKSIGIVLTNKKELEDYQDNPEKYDNMPILGYVDNLKEILKKAKPEEVIISTDRPEHSLLLSIADLCADIGISVKIEPDLYDIFTGQSRAQNIYGIPLIEIRTQILRSSQEVSKRIFDVIFSALVLLIGLPIWVIIAILIKIDSKGPVFFIQERIGKGNKKFKMYKFRSMVQDANKQKASWTKVGDPRVTKVGRFIRKTHIDEIPQFYNVLIGDMSIVGPRPEQPHFVEEFSKDIPHYKRRHKVRPGITGWWQVKYEPPYSLDIKGIENRLKFDFYYIENISFKLDLEIIFRTVFLVFSGHGQT